MTRWIVLVMALVACKKDLGPVHDGISRVDVTIQSKMDDGYYLVVAYTARVQNPTKDPRGITIVAACQVGADRLANRDPAGGDLVAGTATDLESNLYIIHPLPAKPSLCDLEFLDGEVSIGRVCWTDGTVTEAPCPPNRVADDGVGPTGLTAVVTKVTPEDADDIGFPAHLTVEYRATAHKDMPKGAYLVRVTSCPRGSDDTWHSELGSMRAGETMWAAQNTYRIGRPARGAPCETTLGFSQVVDGEVTKIATFCHRDTAITPGACK
jgi:hypothetical protein